MIACEHVSWFQFLTSVFSLVQKAVCHNIGGPVLTAVWPGCFLPVPPLHWCVLRGGEVCLRHLWPGKTNCLSEHYSKTVEPFFLQWHFQLQQYVTRDLIFRKERFLYIYIKIFIFITLPAGHPVTQVAVKQVDSGGVKDMWPAGGRKLWDLSYEPYSCKTKVLKLSVTGFQVTEVVVHLQLSVRLCSLECKQDCEWNVQKQIANSV